MSWQMLNVCQKPVKMSFLTRVKDYKIANVQYSEISKCFSLFLSADIDPSQIFQTFFRNNGGSGGGGQEFNFQGGGGFPGGFSFQFG